MTVGGSVYGVARPITVDAHPSIVARRARAPWPCGQHLHTDPITRGLGNASIVTDTVADSILIDVDGRTLLIDIWAQTDEELDAWIPAAMEFVDSIRFQK